MEAGGRVKKCFVSSQAVLSMACGRCPLLSTLKEASKDIVGYGVVLLRSQIHHSYIRCQLPQLGSNSNLCFLHHLQVRIDVLPLSISVPK
ncbi:hypothetical protein DKX38_018194 [Salix brachista]|uniref:Uncharacterized protein n=1 Tax=Salix brachista TaxID=2182728 RepID=A0A5N5KMD8_9ROSI|nr:hypothetical protein DKX38_018194 [Salix brachista]